MIRGVLIKELCDKYKIGDYEIQPDGIVNVFNSVDISFFMLDHIPIDFGRVDGNFTCSYNNLYSLKGCPKEVGGNFLCSSNRLTSLEYSPKQVGESFVCYNNPLSSLNDISLNIGLDLKFSINRLTVFKHLKTTTIGRTIAFDHADQCDKENLAEIFDLGYMPDQLKLYYGESFDKLDVESLYRNWVMHSIINDN